jgi:hypothetical protein
MYLNRFGALGALAVAALAAQAHAPTLTRPKVEAPGTQHGLARDVRVRPDGSATTSNWSGYTWLHHGSQGFVDRPGSHLLRDGELILRLLGGYRWVPPDVRHR